MISLAVTPYLISQAIDRGCARGRPSRCRLAGAVFVVGVANAVLGILRHRTMTKIGWTARCAPPDAVMTHAVELGAALPGRITAGEVVTIGIGDVWLVAGR